MKNGRASKKISRSSSYHQPRVEPSYKYIRSVLEIQKIVNGMSVYKVSVTEVCVKTEKCVNK